MPPEEAVREEIRKFILHNYEAFAASELTFRMLKTHLSSTLEDVAYTSLSSDAKLGKILDDEVESITQRCDTGKIPAGRCLWPVQDTCREHQESYRNTKLWTFGLCAGILSLLIAVRSIVRSIRKRRKAHLRQSIFRKSKA